MINKTIKYGLLSILFVSIMLSSSIGLLSNRAFAIEAEGPDSAMEKTFDSAIPADPDTLVDILANIVKWLYTIFFIVAVLFILIAAYNFMQGGSNPKAVETAKSQLKYAVIAIVVALVASGVSLMIELFLSRNS
ncbi:MAG TPA: pilin [Candidatus Paceibacterota bacterium]|nr:pilin [Candidatus Paceibacterota bacterium]